MKHGNVFSVISSVLSITIISVQFIACTKATPKITSLGKDAKLMDFGSSGLSSQSTQSVNGLESEIEIKGQCSPDVGSLWIKDPSTGKYLLASEFTKFLSFSDTDCSDGEFKIKLSTKDGAFKYDRQQTARFTVYLRALSRFSELSERAISYEYKKDPNDPEIYFTTSNFNINEGSSFDLTLQLSKPVAAEKSLQISLGFQGADSTASYMTNNFDFKVFDNNNNEINLAGTNSLIFNPGETSKTIHITAESDLNYEDTETVKLIFSNLVGASIVPGKESSIFNIIDKSEAPTFSVTSNISVTEGSTANFRISLSKTTYKNVAFSVSTNEITMPPAGNVKAKSEVDFASLTSANYTISAGNSYVDFSIQTNIDSLWNLLPKVFSTTTTSQDGLVKTTSSRLTFDTNTSIIETDTSNKPILSFKFQKSDGNGGFVDITELSETQAAIDGNGSGGYYIWVRVDKTSDVDLNFKIKSSHSDGSSSDYSVDKITAGAIEKMVGPFYQSNNNLAVGDSTIQWSIGYACLDSYSNSSCSNANGTLDKTFTKTLTIKDDDIGGFTISGVYSDKNTIPSSYLTDATKPKIKWSTASGAAFYDLEIFEGSNSIFKKSNLQITDVDLNSEKNDVGQLISDLEYGKAYTIQLKAFNSDRSIQTTATDKNFNLNRSPKLNIQTNQLHIINSVNSSSFDTILFTDQDAGDVITSQITQQSNSADLPVSINNNVLYFSPKNNFLGTSTINIQVADDKGGLTDISVTVITHNRYQFLGKQDNNLSNPANYCGSEDLLTGCLFDLTSNDINTNSDLIVDSNCNSYSPDPAKNCSLLTFTADRNNSFEVKSLSITSASDLQIPSLSLFKVNNQLTLNHSSAKISGLTGKILLSTLKLFDGNLTVNQLEFFGSSTDNSYISKSLTIPTLKINEHLKINEGSPEQTIFVTSLLNLYSGSVSANSKINFDVSGDISLNKNQKQNGDTNAATDLSSGTVTLTGGNNQTIQGSVGSYLGKFYNLIINKTDGSVTIKDNLSFHADYLVNNGAVAYDSTSAFWFDATFGVNHKIKAPNHNIINFQMSDPTNIEFQSNFSASNQCKYGNTTLFNGQTNNGFTLRCTINTTPFPLNGNTVIYDSTSPLGTNNTTVSQPQIQQPVVQQQGG